MQQFFVQKSKFDILNLSCLLTLKSYLPFIFNLVILNKCCVYQGFCQAVFGRSCLVLMAEPSQKVGAHIVSDPKIIISLFYKVLNR